MPCRSPGPHPGWKFRGLAWGGLQAHTRGGIPACTPLTATAAGGTHPTGMHSCYEVGYNELSGYNEQKFFTGTNSCHRYQSLKELGYNEYQLKRKIFACVIRHNRDW